MSLISVKQHVQRGQFSEGISLALVLLNQKENDTELLYLVAVCHRYLRQFDEACKTLGNLLNILPYYARAHQELGHNRYAQAQLSPALESYLQAVKYNPTLVASWQRIAELSSNEEQQKTAALNLDYLNKLPRALQSVSSFIYEEKLDKAEKLCRHFLTEHPKHIEAMRLLAKIAEKHNVLDDAEFLLEICAMQEPNNHWVQFDYVHVLNRRQKFELAYQKAVLLSDSLPEDTTTRLTLANQQAAVGRYSEAIKQYHELSEIDPANPLIQLLLGHTYKTVGQHHDAISAYKAAITIDPLLCDAYWSLANLKTYTFNFELLTQMEKISKEKTLRPEAAIQLQFALGKAYEDKHDYQKSFNHYQHGNQLKRASIDYKPEIMNDNFMLQKKFFKKEVANRLKAYGHGSKDPIFILGLPRTGSTLIEQILSSHSLIDGTLELPNIMAYVQELNGRKYKNTSGRYPKILSSLEPTIFQEFGERYISETQVHRLQAPYFTDKMPNNFRHIGFIKSILPNAKIIDTRRAPMSCCFSVFKQLFAEGQEFSYSFDDIVAYYDGYLELMEHWHRIYPGEILTIDYETMVSQPTETIDQLFQYLELDAERSCYNFHNTKRAVRTASSEQVRQPINQKGNEQWKNFEPYLDQLKEALQL